MTEKSTTEVLAEERDRYRKECKELRDDVAHYQALLTQRSDHEREKLTKAVADGAFDVLKKRLRQYWAIVLVMVGLATIGGYLKLSDTITDLVERRVADQVGKAERDAQRRMAQIEDLLITLQARMLHVVEQSERFEEVLKSDPTALQELVAALNELDPDSEQLAILHRKMRVHSQQIESNAGTLLKLQRTTGTLADDVQDLIAAVNRLTEPSG